MRDILFAFNGQEMLIITQLNSQFRLEDLHNRQALNRLKSSAAWQLAHDEIMRQVNEEQLDWNAFSNWSGFDLAVDFYRLRNAGELAVRDISSQRLVQYQFFSQVVVNKNIKYLNKSVQDEMTQPLAEVFNRRFRPLFSILQGFKQGLPDDHFMLNLEKGEIVNIPAKN